MQMTMVLKISADFDATGQILIIHIYIYMHSSNPLEKIGVQ
jgi:hypothetical protein